MLELTRANVGRQLVVGYRIRNSTADVLWVVCPEPRCSSGNWPLVPFARTEGHSLVLSALIPVPPPGVVYESSYLHELLAIAPNSNYDGTIELPMPLRSNVPYPSTASSELDLRPVTAVTLELGTLPCLDPAHTVDHRSRVSVGTVLSCAGGKTVENLQTIVSATRKLVRERRGDGPK